MIARLLPFVALLVACAAISCHAADLADEATPLPDPPMQGKPWTPPDTKLPPIVVDAVKELFDQGLADPRGCEYREVEIADAFDVAMIRKVHAWVLPGDGNTKYAVGWNGRVNLVVSVGPPVDLQKDFPLDDLVAIYNKDQEGAGDMMQASGGPGNLVSEHGSLSESSVLPIKVALLLRLGDADLAEGVWKKWKWNNEDPYLAIAREWLISWYYNAINCRRTGKDVLALQAFRKLMPLRVAAEISAARRNIPFPAAPEKYSGGFGFDRAAEVPSKFYFEELNPLRALLADQERRAKEQPYVRVLKSGGPASGAERIAALIRDLEGSDQPLGGSTVRELIRQGDAAIDPLLHCLEEDQRLAIDGEPVYGEAYMALSGIMKISPVLTPPADDDTVDLTPAQRKTLAAKFRDYRDEHKEMTMPGRWFATLQDDNAPSADWGDAAANLVERPGSMEMGSNMFSPHMAIGEGHPDPSEPMRGEAFRAKANPSLSDLIVKRLKILVPTSTDARKPEAATVEKLLRALADWDGKDRAADIDSMARAFCGNLRDSYNPREYPCELITRLYNRMLAAGDPGALARYAGWISSLKPDRDYEKFIFRMMWEHPDDPAIRKAAEKMFAGKETFWRVPQGKPSKAQGEADWPKKSGEEKISNLVNTPMLGIAAYRAVLLKALDDNTIIGYVTPRPGNGFDEELYESFPGSDAPGKGSRDFRRCDYYASELAAADIFPVCDLTWPKAKRDAAVAACKALLKQYGDAFKFGAQDKNNWDFSDDMDDRAQPAFPKLDHPATPEDVAQGRAIFSLKGTVRLLPLPLPLHAERPSSPQDVQNYTFTLPHGKKETSSICLMDGNVWQAEEVLVDGKWQRYYGFAGRHQLEKVPAAEIEFRGAYPWVGVASTLDAALTGPNLAKPGASPTIADHVATPGTPLPMTLKLRNTSDAAQKAPALPQGISLTLFYSKTIPSEAYFPNTKSYDEWGFSTQHFHFDEWTEIPLRKEIVVAAADGPGQSLAAGAELDLLQFDLRDYFDITRPGSYRVVATFSVPGQPDVKSQEIIFSMVQKEAMDLRAGQ